MAGVLAVFQHSSYQIQATGLPLHLPASLKQVKAGKEGLPYITNSVAQEPERSSPHSQQLDTGPCPEPAESNPHQPSQSP
jgi:hypothetical protein